MAERPGLIDAGDNSFVGQTVSDLDLQILRNGQVVAESIKRRRQCGALALEHRQVGSVHLRVVLGTNVYGGTKGSPWPGSARRCRNRRVGHWVVRGDPCRWSGRPSTILRTIDSIRRKCLTLGVTIA